MHIPIPSPKKLSNRTIAESNRDFSSIRSDSKKTFCERFQRASLRLSHQNTPLMHPTVKQFAFPSEFLPLNSSENFKEPSPMRRRPLTSSHDNPSPDKRSVLRHFAEMAERADSFEIDPRLFGDEAVKNYLSMGMAVDDSHVVFEEAHTPLRFNSMDRFPYARRPTGTGEVEKRETISSRVFSNSRIQETLEHNNDTKRNQKVAPRKYLLDKNPQENSWIRGSSDKSPQRKRPSS